MFLLEVGDTLAQVRDRALASLLMARLGGPAVLVGAGAIFVEVLHAFSLPLAVRDHVV